MSKEELRLAEDLEKCGVSFVRPEQLRAAASLIRAQQEALTKYRAALDEIADGDVYTDIGLRDVARTALSESSPSAEEQ
jgi:hypothetical protein